MRANTSELSLCLDFLRKEDLKILVAIFYDNVEEQKQKMQEKRLRNDNQKFA